MVLCVIAATTFWVLNALNKDNYVTVVNYPISFQYNADEYMAVEKLPSDIRIEINGNGWDLFRKYFNVNVTPFTIELSNPDKQDYLVSSAYRRSLEEMIAPTNLVSILTDTLKFDIDKIITKEIEVDLDTAKLSLAQHHKLGGDISIDPQTISLKGPESKVEQLGSTLFISLEEEEIHENIDQYIPILVPELLEPYITVDPKTIKVSFEVIAFIEGNKRVKLEKTHFPKNVSLDNDINTVLMKYRVDERNVEDLKALELTGILNYRHRNKEDSSIQVELANLPPYIRSVEIEPNTFKLVYE